MIHGDLKPENVMYNPSTNDLRLIDFGLACSELSELDWVVQTRYYRAPEVLFGLPYSTAIDMWSLGCLICFLILGCPIFKGSSSHDQILSIIEVLGLPPKAMAEKAPNKVQIFNEDLTLKMVDEDGKAIRKMNFKDLATVLNTDDSRLIDFLRGCFEFDPAERLTPEMALRHPWITRSDMDEECPALSIQKVDGMDEESMPLVKNLKTMMDEAKSTMDSSCNLKGPTSGLSLSNKGSHEYLEPVSVSSAKKM
jgi:serine/threonine protein kinase